MTLAICVVHYRDTKAIDRMLKGIAGWGAIPARCIIVDNSGELVAEELREKYSALLINVINPGQNLGYAAAGNIGLRLCVEHQVESMLMLTQDARVDEHLVAALQRNLNLQPGAGAVAPLLAFVSKPEVTFSRGGYLLRDGRFNHHMALEPIAAVRGHGVISVDWVDGACLLIRVRAASEVGLMPEDYFLYAEDVDFGLELRAHGWSVQVDTGVVAQQEPGNFSSYFRGRNLLHFLIKRRRLFVPYAIPMFLAKEVVYASRRGGHDLLWTLRGLVDATRGRMGRPPSSLFRS